MTIDRSRFQKVWKLAQESPSIGERAAAKSRAEAMLTAAGLTLADAPGLLAEPERSRPPNIFDGFEDWMEQRDPGYKAREKAKRAERERLDGMERAEVIARYGGTEKAVLAWTARELVLRDAVLMWCTFDGDPEKSRYVHKVDGVGQTIYRNISERVVAALSAALPLPRTVTEAKVELDSWERRDRDLGLIYGNTGDTQLDLPSDFRREIVRNLFEEKLRAADLAEVLLRQRYYCARDFAQEEIEHAILADLEALAAAHSVQNGQDILRDHWRPESVQNGRQHAPPQTASARRATVLAMLADPATAALPDREIARRSGVSPSTVGNIRRRAMRRQGELFGVPA